MVGARGAAVQYQRKIFGDIASVELDRLDLKILAALHRDGRITKVELSESVGLSTTPCCTRIERLEREGFIRGYHADVDIERLASFNRFIVTVSLHDYTPEKARRFEAIIADIPFIVECDAVFGSIDYVLEILALSTEHYHEIVEPMLELELDYTTFPVSRHLRKRADSDLADLVDTRFARRTQSGATLAGGYTLNRSSI
jgi:Lrp/AsnC family transcriptional regulator of ectoine degradation